MYSILYVDDEPQLLELGQIYLQNRWGMRVTTASSAEEAMRNLKIQTYDIIISDYQMPEMDGISFLKKLRDNNYTEPFILFTGKGREEIIIEALNSGADFYLQKGGKPMAQFSELVNMINKAVEKNRAEIEKQKINNKLSAIINHLPDPTFVVDEHGLIVSWNHAIENLTGIKSSETLGQTAKNIFSRLCGRNHIPLLNMLIDPTPELNTLDLRQYKDIPLTDERQLPDIYGKTYTVWIKVSPIFSEDGSITGAIETIRDITELKENEIKLRETSQFLQNIIDFMPDPTFVIDSKKRVIAWNHAIEAMTGVEAPDIIGKSNYAYTTSIYSEKRPLLIDQIFDKTIDLNSYYDFIKEAGNNLMAEIYNERLYQGKGAYIWAIASPLYDVNGNISGAIESIRDISDRKGLEIELQKKYEDLASSYEEIAAQNEEIRSSFDEISEQKHLLTESELRFRTLVDKLPCGVIIHQDGLIQYINSIGMAFLGYNSPLELVNSPILDIVHPEHRGDIQYLIRDIPKARNPFYEQLFIRNDGIEIPVEVAGFPIHIGDSKPMITFFRDISIEYERKEALNQAKNKLNILSSITRHDVKNHMSGLMTIMDLITDEEISESREFLLKKASNFCHNILEELQTSFEYQTLGVEEPEWFNLIPLVTRAARIHQIDEKSYTYTGEEIEVYADPLIGKVVENLIDNSIRHGKNVRMISFKTEVKSDHLLFIYEDDGGGIPDNEKERIFQEGYGKHSGLGLFLINGILSMTGMNIRECGNYGKGVRFEIDIPPGKWRVVHIPIV